ncbi:glycoside hydrolase/deacetylase [Hesseltinella vesiculosa]|uniref:Glycoside hydrolase/deacetylase n=1 Tax=Hesseltinella vesiculosa TaxID=101127 RepID=A0A1X2GUK9_9FUNG|nr:glycoside hydrolase/deacetylase [Hesseltinella vesiculosa]
MRYSKLTHLFAVLLLLAVFLQLVQAKKHKEEDDEDDDDDDIEENDKHTAPANGIPPGEEIKTPREAVWLKNVDLSKVPNLPRRKVGSGRCANANCDGPDNDRCFETCGNKPDDDDYYGCPDRLNWALTFDDGPSLFTKELLDTLDQMNVKATFCVMGAHVKLFPEFLKRAADSGHQIASHTYSHPHLMSLSNEDIIYEMRATDEEIFKVTGIRPKFMRPPFGEADQRVKGLLKSMGYKILMWNVDPKDYEVYENPNAAEQLQQVIDAAIQKHETVTNPHDDPGFISLQHDLYDVSVKQVPIFVKKLRDLGYNLTTAAQCVKESEPHYNQHFLPDPLLAQHRNEEKARLEKEAAAKAAEKNVVPVAPAPKVSQASSSYATSTYLLATFVAMPFVALLL